MSSLTVSDSSSPRDQITPLHIKETDLSVPDKLKISVQQFAKLDWFIHQSETNKNGYMASTKRIRQDLEEKVLRKIKVEFTDEYCFVGRRTETDLQILAGWTICSFQNCTHLLTHDIDMASYRLLLNI